MAYWGIKGRNKGQVVAMEKANNDKPFLFLTGPAGTGKTLVTQAVAFHRTLDEHEFRKIIYTRMQLQVGVALGFLTGSIDEKTYPFIAPFMDNLELLGGVKKLGHLLYSPEEKRKVFFDPIQTIRGRSIPDTFIMIDEAQNLDIDTIFALATRPAVNELGKSSKIVFMGNFAQVDDPHLRNSNSNGLYQLLKGLYDKNAHEYFDHVNLTEVERHPVIALVEEILRNQKMSEVFTALEAMGNVK